MAYNQEARRGRAGPQQIALPGMGPRQRSDSSDSQTPKHPGADSLVKYEKPVLLQCPKARPLKPTSITAAPKLKLSPSETIKQQTEEILSAILPPREWKEGNQRWVQHVSTAPCTRPDVVQLERQLKTKLQLMQARQTGICPVRRELYPQCFDELIRQVTINCAERGLLLARVREEIQMTIGIYQALYESSAAFGMRTAMQAEKIKGNVEKKIAELESEKELLLKQLKEERGKCDEIEKRNNESHEIEEMKRREEIWLLKKTIEQFKAQLEGIISQRT